ncbi:hypothetical protein GCM10028807_06380 [Spirosoma daeguense]
MKYSLLVLILLVFVQACRSKKQEVNPNGEAKLLGITIPSFPAQNIAIDHDKKQIVLTAPVNTTVLSFVATAYQTSPNSSIWNEGPYPVNICGMLQPEKQLGIYVLGKDNQLNIYKFVVKPADNLNISFIDNQATATIGQPIGFQIDNFTDGVGIGQIILTRTDSPERDTLQVQCCYGVYNCPDRQPTYNQYAAGIPEHVRPGEYTVEIKKANGRQAVAKQKLRFRKGTPLLESFQFKQPILAKSQSLLINGENLFADDSPELLFRRVTGERFRVKPTNVSTFGRSLRIDLPADLTPGYYYVQLMSGGQAIGATYRFTVLRQPEQPSVFSIDTLLASATASPLVLQRMKNYSASIQPEYGSYTDKLEVKLTDVDNLTRSVVFTYRTGSFNGDYPGGLKIPESVTPGKYSLRIVATYSSGKVIESEPLERQIIVR